MKSFPHNILSDLETTFAKAMGSSVHIVGSQSTVALASILGSPDYIDLHKKPQVVVVASDAHAQDLEQALLFFNPHLKIHTLEGFDVSPYSGLYPNFRSIAQRIYWLYRAQYSTGGEVFIAPIQYLIQKTLPKELVDQFTTTLKINDEISPAFLKKLIDLGYQNSPRVEDVGQFSIKGGLVDIFSPAHEHPIRIELFGDYIESMRFFNQETQRTLDQTTELVVLPVRETLFHDKTQELVLKQLNEKYKSGNFSKEFKEQIYESLMMKRFFHGIDFLTPYFYENLNSPLDYFDSAISLYQLDPLEITRQYDKFISDIKSDYEASKEESISPSPEMIYEKFEKLKPAAGSTNISLSSIELLEADQEKSDQEHTVYFKSSMINIRGVENQEIFEELKKKISEQHQNKRKVIISTHTQSQAERVKILLDKFEFSHHLHAEDFFDFSSLLESRSDVIDIIPRPLPESVILENEGLAFLREEDFFGKKEIRKPRPQKNSSAYSKSIILSDLKIGDYIVHSEFGVGVYEGLKPMNVGSVESEFIQIKYQGDDKLYLPVYRINLIRKFSGGAAIDKLGGSGWKKTKIKVRSHLKDIASELLALYAKRAQVTRPPFKTEDVDYKTFEGHFAYDETPDQLEAIDSILNDMHKDTPMDRLICGDVGFGKTEVAMRAAFKCAQDQRQVAVLVPTTILSFQHFETFKKRFKSWPLKIEMLSRFTPTAKAREVVEGLKSGSVDIVIGTHRVLSKDIVFKNLGLLIVDEEHKFGVTHKEKIKKLKNAVDTIAMSATPIPRTLNMSLMGIRDLSLINTAPQDRLPVRTFICKFEDSVIKKAIENEVQRGGQVYFLHNRVQSIAEVAHKLQELVPDVRLRYAHGQMDEDELETTMIAFFKQEFDVLVSTTIIESGMDVQKANTIIIDRADTLGLSQLYQLRGRVGRSNERAYCYLVIPKSGALDPIAQERLKVLQENTELGSGLRIAHHDLELRGAGNILGEEQAGHANSVGYELYIELLEQALKEARGEDTQKDDLEPEINLRIPALIPHDYIPDIRVRMGYYNALSRIESPDDMDRFEADMSDQFGKVPEQVMNLMGMMLLKKYCKDLAIRDLSAGAKSISLAFTDFTPIKSDVMIELVTGRPKKYSITPDSRLIVQMTEISWPQIYSELNSLKTYA
ncbi:MAG: transcription-repair coupling factor [Bdellovibrionota bacterium]